MRITRIEPIPVRVPLKAGLTTKTAHGEHVDSPYVVVRVHTDEGLVGLGEATLAPRWSGETTQGCVAVIEQLLAPALVRRLNEELGDGTVRRVTVRGPSAPWQPGPWRVRGARPHEGDYG